jgi:hypothetical protein
MEDVRNAYTTVVKEPKSKIPRVRWENIKMGLKEIDCGLDSCDSN